MAVWFGASIVKDQTKLLKLINVVMRMIGSKDTPAVQAMFEDVTLRLARNVQISRTVWTPTFWLTLQSHSVQKTTLQILFYHDPWSERSPFPETLQTFLRYLFKFIQVHVYLISFIWQLWATVGAVEFTLLASQKTPLELQDSQRWEKPNCSIG